MNERIRELFKKAGGKTSTRNLASNPVQVVKTHELWDDRIEKFAELIVKECIDIAEQTRYDGKVVAERIKFVFGVEE
jgi:predicted naringenin-chalcone synthase